MTGESEQRTDEQLMGTYARGDAAAFEVLFERHRAALFRYLLHQTGNRETAEDLFQEVFFRFIRARKKYAARGSFEGWLYTIARNALADHRRRAEVRSVVQSAEDPSGAAWAEQLVSRDPSGDPLLMTEIGVLRERIKAALRRIPEAQREVFLLRENSGLDFERIARITGSGVATAKSRMRLALVNLRRILSADPAGVSS